MKNIIGKTLAYAMLLMLALCSCEDAKNDIIDGNHVYLANPGAENIRKVTVDDVNGSSYPILVRMKDKASKATTVNIQIDEVILKKYNEVSGTNYQLLPTEFYTLDSTWTVIPADVSSGSPINVNIKPLSAELNKTGLTYVVPVSIASVEDSNIPIMTDISNFIFIVMSTPYADVPVMKRANGMQMKLKDETLVMTSYTIEFLVKVDKLGKGKNNQILFNGRAADGNEIFSRFAADGTDGKWDKFQLKNQGLNFDAKTDFKNNVWYHIACVNDHSVGTMTIYVNGALDSKHATAQKATTITSATEPGIRFCGESNNDKYMVSNMQASEIRLWTVARSDDEVKNNMYAVDPESKGLYAYWKLNEATGNVLKDVTGNGNDGAIFGANATWKLNQKMEVGKEEGK